MVRGSTYLQFEWLGAKGRHPKISQVMKQKLFKKKQVWRKNVETWISQPNVEKAEHRDSHVFLIAQVMTLEKYFKDPL